MTPTGPFDPFSADALRDPYPWYEWLRDSEPVYHVPSTDIWTVSRYADVEATLRNHAVFSSTGGVGPEWRQHPMMSMYDPPEHTRLRRIVSKHFTPKYLATLAPRIQANTDTCLDALLAAGNADFVSDFAEPLIANLIADLLGIPPERRGDFRRWSSATVSALATGIDQASAGEAEKTRVELVKYLKQVVAERRKGVAEGGPGAPSDVIGFLVAANDADALTASEVTAFCVLLLIAGFETTVNGLANVVHLLASSPGLWSEVATSPALVPSMIEEALRLEAPVQAFFRNTLVSATVAGVTIPERSKVMVLFGSANRDPRKYDRPTVYDVHRNPTDHLGMGAGVHHCIGAPLARLQYAIAVRAVLLRVASMDLSEEPTRTLNALMRGFRKLPVVLHAR